MDETWARLGLISGALLIAGLAAMALQRRSRRPVRSVVVGDLLPGVYLLSSATCPACGNARRKLDARLGSGNFTELTWEGDRERFESLGVDVVPSVLVVDGAGRGRLFQGQPEPALAELGP
jgi:hypothetical protein